MADLAIGTKARRALGFILGLGDPHIRRRLEPNGFDDAELTKGTELFNALTDGRLNRVLDLDPKLLGAIDAWENHWFPIVEVVLRTNYPAVHELVFRNLTQTEGVDVVVSVRTLIDRVDLVAKPVRDGGHREGPAARKLLERRGFTAEVIGEGRALLAKVGTISESADPLQPLEPEALAKAEEQMWNWYLEWSGIARTVIHDRRSLRALGFLRRVRRADGREEDVVVDDEDTEDPAGPVIDPTPAPTPDPTPEPEPVL